VDHARDHVSDVKMRVGQHVFTIVRGRVGVPETPPSMESVAKRPTSLGAEYPSAPIPWRGGAPRPDIANEVDRLGNRTCRRSFRRPRQVSFGGLSGGPLQLPASERQRYLRALVDAARAESNSLLHRPRAVAMADSFGLHRDANACLTTTLTCRRRAMARVPIQRGPRLRSTPGSAFRINAKHRPPLRPRPRPGVGCGHLNVVNEC
jgi:hypothetical protein